MNKPSKRSGKVKHWFGRIAAWPGAAVHYFVNKWRGRAVSKKLAQSSERLLLSPVSLQELSDAWKPLAMAAVPPAGTAEMEASQSLGSIDSSFASAASFQEEERAVVARIREQTKRCNRNNVTRTAAYLAFYRRHPEVHWAFLAHMVSRNGGWNMTDLQGELLPRLLHRAQREATFGFLERANALIFGDAYPQLLLYEAGMQAGRELTHLLPAFGVSRFMAPVWSQFWRRRDPAILTVALIVNEQNFIEQRIVRHPYYRKHVLDAAFFGMQSLLQLNQILFPYELGKGSVKLGGIILEDFKDLHERIEFGKRLYAMLFSVPLIYEGAYSFACAVRHTGSRTDYAPHLFSMVRHRPRQRKYRERLEGCRLRPGAEPLYSPALAAAWPDVPLEPAEPGDWFKETASAAGYFRELALPRSFEITNEYGFALQKVEIAILAAQQFGTFAPK
ncbi:DUF2515 domain-containing protein [Paenibacillus abyssi]|uniref:DUF2515 domain-containing protein n=1 Tax=Paenibacillus abyssi TaxID=1340531 RepID=A0A917FVR0_9BACL|nr:DUF2515 domain-containing protein [Paenibacillus abyssi]GGG12808.1 hypothetical protein GCM10010916_32160 [Paenibacillus abyssi]